MVFLAFHVQQQLGIMNKMDIPEFDIRDIALPENFTGEIEVRYNDIRIVYSVENNRLSNILFDSSRDVNIAITDLAKYGLLNEKT